MTWKMELFRAIIIQLIEQPGADPNNDMRGITLK